MERAIQEDTSLANSSGIMSAAMDTNRHCAAGANCLQTRSRNRRDGVGSRQAHEREHAKIMLFKWEVHCTAWLAFHTCQIQPRLICFFLLHLEQQIDLILSNYFPYYLVRWDWWWLGGYAPHYCTTVVPFETNLYSRENVYSVQCSHSLKSSLTPHCPITSSSTCTLSAPKFYQL